jgi:S1-C subfamily serine protease
VLFIAALCIAQQLKAQEPCPLVPPAACVKVLVKDKGGEGDRSGGTGALIGPRLVVTCNHVVKDRQGDKVEILFPNWRLVQARVIAVDKKIDLCLIEMDEDHGTPFSLSVRAQWSTGDQFTVMGYGYGPFKAAQGPLNGSGWGDYWKMVEDATARSGDSGGPVIDSEGR